jgi:hypothetical protein
MKSGVVMSSQLTSYGRFDAEFHLAIQSIAEDLAVMREKDISPDACKSQLKHLPLYAYEPLKPLLTGKATLTRETAMAAIEKYPLEAWLLVKNGISAAHDTLAEKEKELERERQALRRFF